MHIDTLLKKLAKPAQRAIENEGITTIEDLCKYSEKEFSKLHGIGKNALNIISITLKENGFAFSNKDEKKMETE
jgi:DNA-directed RNA polymerase alpha subunit